MKLVLATGNLHKRDEIVAILGILDVTAFHVETLRDYPQIHLPAETGATFLENARQKALAVSHATGEWALADDSGLVVDALGGAPGIHSARYAGENASDADRIAKLLDEMEGIPFERRTARFVCAMALTHGESVIVEVEGVCEGIIALEPKGTSGFGYDPVFTLPNDGKTMAEVGPEVKNRLSHRARALQALRKTFSALV